MLRGVGDPFGGVVCASGEMPETASDFARALSLAVSAWQRGRRRGVWLELPGRLLATHVPVALSEGFRFHHADADHAVLVRWLPTDEPDRLPSSASHFVGVGGLVRNARGEILLVRERYVTGKMWKLPGGLAESGETLGEAAVREVREETGVRTTFESILCVRHLPVARFGKYGDLYFVAKLKLHDEPGSDTIRADPEEIAECKWMSIADYLAHEHTPELMKRIVQVSETVGARPVELAVRRPDGPTAIARKQFLYIMNNVDSMSPKL